MGRRHQGFRPQPVIRDVRATRSRLFKRETNQKIPICPSPDIEASDNVFTSLEVDLLGLSSPWEPSHGLSSVDNYLSSGLEMVDLFAGAGSSNQPAPSEGNESEGEPLQSHLQYVCPYRDRNPRIFNVSDFPSCAFGSFNTISDVRQHIIEDHRSKDFTSQCPGCSSWFRSDTSRNDHLRCQSCIHPPSILADDYDRGINEVTAAQLETGPAGEGMATWRHLWGMIFPAATDFQAPPPSCRKVDASTQTDAQESNSRSLGDEACSSRTESNASSLASEIGSVEVESHAPHDVGRPTMDRQATIPDMTSPLRQVGLARVHIEILSLSEQHQHWGYDETGSLDGFDSETDSEGSDYYACSLEAQDSDGSPGRTSTGTPSTAENANQGQTFVSATGQPGPSHKRNRVTEGEGDGNDNEPPEKKRRRQPRDVDPSRRRFACPYQVSGLSDNCFRPSRRNPSGGCDSISRLKDHMTRKHMVSYRCQRCWKHFNAREKAQIHPQSNCLEQDAPNYERFMTEAEEIEVETCAGLQPEDMWWKLFQLLIPDMSGQDISQLKILYSPYYRCYIDTSLTFPSMTLPNISFEPFHTQLSSLGSPSDAFFGLGNTSLLSQSFPVPIFATAVPQSNPLPPFDGLGLQSTPGSTTQQSDSTTQSDRTNALPTRASSSPDTSQIQRNYERLKLRTSQTDTENGELRATISSVREEVRKAGALLEDVLGMDNVEGEIYDRLSRVAEMLISATGRLR